jgi:Ca2+-transporting ATPase
VTDGLPALALVIDPVEDDVLRRPPRHPDEPMLGRPQWTFIVATGLLLAAVTLSVFVWALRSREVPEARNLAFSVLVFGELFRAFAARSTTRPIWEIGVFSNVPLLAVVAGTALLQVALHFLPATETAFQIAPLTLADADLTLLLALIPVVAIEGYKLVRRRR